MSLAYRADQRTDLKQRQYGFIRDYDFILALVCMALALVVASAIFTPATVGTGINDQIWFVGP
jgi:hypothetical protein